MSDHAMFPREQRPGWHHDDDDNPLHPFSECPKDESCPVAAVFIEMLGAVPPVTHVTSEPEPDLPPMPEPVIAYLAAIQREFNPTGWAKVSRFIRWRLNPVSRWRMRGRGQVRLRLNEVRNRRQFVCWLRGCVMDREQWSQHCGRCGMFIP